MSAIAKAKELRAYYICDAYGVRRTVRAVDDISIEIRTNEVYGIVGESGCGKTTIGKTMLRLIDATSGSVKFEGEDVFAMDRKDLKKLRRDMQVIFQDPFSSLNPRKPIGDSILDGLQIHNIGTQDERWEMLLEVLERVGLKGYHARRFPYEFSGGQRQRIGIARALILKPKFIVCDEPVSALDVSIQAQVLNLMQDLQQELGLTYMFITHDLSVVKHFSDDIGVMYLGQMVEKAESKDLFAEPMHPYTKALLSAIPVPSLTHKRERVMLEGEITSPINPAPGCRFAKRCPLAESQCSQNDPVLREVKPGHFVACHLV